MAEADDRIAGLAVAPRAAQPRHGEHGGSQARSAQPQQHHAPVERDLHGAINEGGRPFAPPVDLSPAPGDTRPMKRILSLLLALAALSCSHSPAREEGWRPLFDGRTLSGWTPKISGHALGEDPLRTFRVQDGAIRVSYENYGKFAKRFGHLAYRAPFSAYRLRFQYRFSGRWLPDVEAWQQSNSGAMLHAQPPETMTRDQSFPVSIEVQLLGADRAEPSPTANLCTPGTHVVMNGKLETTHCINSQSPIIPNGRWVNVEIEVDRAGNFTHFVEGRPVMRYGGAQYDPTDPDAKPLIARNGGSLGISSGYIYLQSEGHPVEFRGIEIRPL
jgi:hypothetical protein